MIPTPHSAKRPPTDRPTPAPLPLSEREQQVCEYLSQGVTFEAIASHLNISPAAAKAYHRRALDKHQRTTALTSLEQGDSSAQGDRSTTAQPEPASAEPPRDRPVIAAPALPERPNPLDLFVPSLFVTGDRVANGESFHGRSHFSQTTITDRPPHPRRNRPSRCNGWAGVGDRRAAAS